MAPFLFLLAASTITVPDSALPLREPSTWIRRVVQETEFDVAKTELGRRLLAVSAETPLLEDAGLPEAYVLRFRTSPRWAIAFHPGRARTVNSLEFELALVRERFRAAADLPIEVVEGEQAAYQAELEYAVEKAVASPLFAAKLRKSYEAAERKLDARRRTENWAVGSGEPLGAEDEVRSPRDPLERLGFYLALFIRDADEFYWAVERDRVFEPGVQRLGVLSDFLAAHGGSPGDGVCAERSRYCVVDHKPYPAALVRAALAAREAGGFAKIGEAVGLFRTEALRELTPKVNRWLREGK